MDFFLDNNLANGYKSASQITRRLTENWVLNNVYCPRCGNTELKQFKNNMPVADFYCENCKSQYELKSKATALGNKVADGAYDTMISRITSNTNPDFFMLNYLSDENRVTDLIVIPKYFMTPNIIERRNPLSTTARRAGWTGCNILIGDVPKQGKIDIIKDGIELPRNQVIDKIGFSAKFKKKRIDARGWLLDVLDCVNLTDSEFFSLKDMYAYVDILKKKHKGNNNIQEKIRQQLQILRDRGVVEFIQRGKYRKIMP